jgi:hypothetical protein
MAPVTTRYRTFRAVQAILRILKPQIGGGLVVAAFATVTLLASCDTDENPLAPYEGERPFIIQTVTQSYSPDLQWVGGRAMAVGINRGEVPALDSTLVWMRISSSSDISSPLSISEEFDIDEVMSRGGQPTDSLEDGVVYTVWVADQEALDAGLDTTLFDQFSLIDSTFQASYLLTGRSGGGVDVDFSIVRNQTLAGDEYVLNWTPVDLSFRQIAIRQASSGGFTNLLWHVVIPEEEDGEMRGPLIVGETPPDAVVGTEWAGWGDGTHTLWATTEEWDGESFGFNSPGYAFYQMFASNFE